MKSKLFFENARLLFDRFLIVPTVGQLVNKLAIVVKLTSVLKLFKSDLVAILLLASRIFGSAP